MTRVTSSPDRIARRTIFAVLILACAGLGLSGCIEHRVTVNPPAAAETEPAGENKNHTVMVTGSRFQTNGTTPELFSSPLPLDIPVSVYRRHWDGSMSRGELRCTTPLPWWQRFPADAFVDFSPVHATCDASTVATLTPVTPIPRAQLLEQAIRDGYAQPHPTIKP
jgi:hypothetical protein